MPDRVKGITIALSGDTSGLTKSLEKVDGQLKTTKNELKDVERLLKLDPTNVELLEQKQRLLAQSTEDTSKKLGLLEEAAAKMREEMDNSEEVTREQQAAYENLQREIISTKDYLDKDTEALKNTERAMKDATSRSKDFEDALGKVADKARLVSEKTRVLSGAAAGALAGLAGIAIKGAKSADELNTLSRQTGLSTDALQEMQYASELIDVNFDTFTGSAEKMIQTLRTNEDAFTNLGIATRNASGEYLSADEIYWQAISALGEIRNETERDIAAQELFGRSSADLAGLIDDGGASFQQYAQEAQDMGLILDGETLDSMNAVNDQLDRLKAQAEASFFTMAAPALEALTPLLDVLMEKLGGVFEWIASLDTEQLELIAIVLGVVAAISPLAGLISGITTVVSLLTPVVQGLFGVLSANPIGLIIGLIALLAIAVYENWDKIKPVLDKIKEGFITVFEKIKDAFGQFVDGIKRLFEALKEGIKKPINLIIGMINKLISGINFLLDNPIANAVGGLFGTGTPQIPTLPMLAQGGTLTSGSAIVGEAGPEILSMNGSRATVTPLTASVDTSGIERALAGLAGGGAPINLALNIDGKAFARATYGAQEFEASRRGGRLVTV